MISYKFVLERILGRAVNFNVNDKLLWQEILPGIIGGKEDERVGREMGEDGDGDGSGGSGG